MNTSASLTPHIEPVNYGYLFFGKKLPLNMGMGPELPAAHPDQSKSENLQAFIPSQPLIKYIVHRFNVWREGCAGAHSMISAKAR